LLVMKKATDASSPSPDPQIVSDAVTEYLSSFAALTRKPEEVLKGNQLPAHFDIQRPAYARSNRTATREAIKAARDHKLQSPRFEAVRGKWSDHLQMVLLIPESKFVEGDPDLYEVSWSNDGVEMRIDLADALVPRQWATPPGMIRRVKATLYRNLPEHGSALVLDLPGGEIREAPKVVRDRKQRKAEKEAGGQATAAGGQSTANADGTIGNTGSNAGKADATPGKADATPGKAEATPGKAEATTPVKAEPTTGKTEAPPAVEQSKAVPPAEPQP
jgi:hypothetical protein